MEQAESSTRLRRQVERVTFTDVADLIPERGVAITSENSPSAASEVHAPSYAVEFEGDYRPATASREVSRAPRVSIPSTTAVTPHVDFLLRLADALNNTLDLQTLMLRVAELVRAVVHYRIFAILLINDRTNELWMRFQIGHAPEIERARIKLGRGVVGQAAATRHAVLMSTTSPWRRTTSTPTPTCARSWPCRSSSRIA